tara:strand:+ start:1501 stop:1707 length:207 start_codon:yes stop_codon:yes gene_type:complete
LVGASIAGIPIAIVTALLQARLHEAVATGGASTYSGAIIVLLIVAVIADLAGIDRAVATEGRYGAATG